MQDRYMILSGWHRVGRWVWVSVIGLLLHGWRVTFAAGIGEHSVIPSPPPPPGEGTRYGPVHSLGGGHGASGDETGVLGDWFSGTIGWLIHAVLVLYVIGVVVGLLALLLKLLKWILSSIVDGLADSQISKRIERNKIEQEENEVRAHQKILVDGLPNADAISQAVFQWLRNHEGQTVQVECGKPGNREWTVPSFRVLAGDHDVRIEYTIKLDQ